MAVEKPETLSRANHSSKITKFLQDYGWDVFLASIAGLHMFMAPYTKVKESFNVQLMEPKVYVHGNMKSLTIEGKR